MCFHNTYLFSFCGHVSISQHPINHTKPCSKAQSITALDSTSSNQQDSDTPVSVHAFTSSFPSPHEFELAKQLHNSVPASPTTPIIPIRDRDSAKIINACGATHISPQPNGGSVSSPDGTTKLLSCSRPARHPLHTYILPLLCGSCQNSRIRNIAYFEAQMIRETVERETTFGYNKNGVVDPERKKVAWKSTARRKSELIPLICVEEAKIQRENIFIPSAGDAPWAERVTADSESGEQDDDDEENKKLVEEMEQMNVRIQVEAMGASRGSSDVVHADGDVSTDAERLGPCSGQVGSTTAASTATATASPSSGWPWWGKSTASALAPGSIPGSPAPVKIAALANANSKQGSGHKKIGSRISVALQRPASPRVNVSRDVFGRNLKGMNRIMGWDSGGGGVQST